MIKKIIRKYKLIKNPVEYWRSRGMKIGEGCEIYPTANFGSEPYLITVGNHVRINEGVKFVTHDGGVWVLRGYIDTMRDIDMFGKIAVGNNVHIGTNAIIMPNVEIGNNCVIGCGAIVTKSIPDNSVAVGVPARVIETIEEYKEKNSNKFVRTKMLSPKEKKCYLQEKYK